MIKKNIVIQLPEGNFPATIMEFDKNDREELKRVYQLWRSLCDMMSFLESRTINLPEGLSEGAFCLEMGAVRVFKNIQNANSSFDCYDEKRKKRIQVKACSVMPDLTSFGPRSVWDEIYLIDFYRKGAWDGTFDIYALNSTDIYNHKVNKYQTLRDQQTQGKRPRFSIYNDIIKPKGLKPKKTGGLFS